MASLGEYLSPRPSSTKIRRLFGVCAEDRSIPEIEGGFMGRLRVSLNLLFAAMLVAVAAYTAETNYPDGVLADKPVGYWRLDSGASESVANKGIGGVILDGQTVGKVER